MEKSKKVVRIDFLVPVAPNDDRVCRDSCEVPASEVERTVEFLSARCAFHFEFHF